MASESCQHTRTIIIAKDQHEEYLECLDCGEILNPAARELESAPAEESGESLSDA
ncbi:MAG TPA: hypothetical protein VFU57_06710 [Candidatus Acidoferrales bacterium]|nr:hypothetical protein [Candidatus Acidoferrales bacterium]